MIIKLTYDPSVSSAPSGFVTAVNWVVGLYEATFVNNVTINLDVGWGEVDGSALDSKSLGESEWSGGGAFTYSQIYNAAGKLAAVGDPIPAQALSISDPTNGGRIAPSRADARALGLLSANSTVTDGWVGFGSSTSFDFSPAAQGASGKFDAIGVIEHEISEVMGRFAGLTPTYSVLDLYRYSAPGVQDPSGAGSDYFSVNRGVSNLDYFNTDPTGDSGDWASSAGADSFLAFSPSGRANRLTNADLMAMAAIGWIDTPSPAISAVFEAPGGALAAGQKVTIALDFNADVFVTGAPTLSLSDGGTASYVSGSGGHGLVFQYTPSVAESAAPTPTTVNLNGGSIANGTGVLATLALAPVSQYAAVISGAAGGTTLTGSGSDMFVIGGGNDTVTGVSGVNTAAFTGVIAQYYVAQSGSTVTVTDGLPGRDGVATLNNVQQVKFSDITLVFDLHSSQDLLVYELYQAAYARMPDNAGFRFWAGVADATNASAVSLADAFITAPEFTAKYGGNPSDTTFVTELYSNVLGRAPDQAGLNYWIGVAQAGAPHDQLLVAFATSAENAQLIGQHIATGYWTS